MSVQTLSTDELADGAAEPVMRDAAPHVVRILAVAAVCLGVAALAAATFVLSYSPIRAVALQAGITPRLARGYPLLLDAMLIIVLAAVLALRGAGLPSRLLAWVTLLLVMAVAAGADALHTAGRTLPHQTAAITAAVLPFVLVLVAFALLLVMLRYARVRRIADVADSVSAYGSGWAVTHPAAAQVTAAEVTVVRPAQVAAAPFEHGLGAPTLADVQLALAREADLAAGDPIADESVSEPATGTSPYPTDALATGYFDDSDAGPEYPALTAEAERAYGAEEVDRAEEAYRTEDVYGVQETYRAEEVYEAEEPYAGSDEDDGPVFHRLFSAPVLLDIQPTDVEPTDLEPTDLEPTAAQVTEAEPAAEMTEDQTTEDQTTADQTTAAGASEAEAAAS